MAKSSIQFQKGLSLTEFQSLYGTEEQCRQALFDMRWPDGFACPQCGHDHYSLIRTRAVYECSQCKHQSTVTAGTIFHATKLPLTVWFLGMYLMTQNKNGVSILEMRRQLGISCNAAWRMKHKIMQVMLERDRGRKLEGDVHLDDSYLGGERIGGKRGRGTRGKTPFIIAVEMHNDQPAYIRLNRVSRFSRHELELWSHEYLTPGSTVTSDGLDCFTRVTVAGCEHRQVITGSGKKAGKNPVFTWLNTILGNIKNSLRGSYHSFRPKHTSRYLAEFQYRFNRRFDLCKMIPGLIYAAVHTSPKPEPVLSRPEFRW
jgi:transposase-like protein